MTHEQILQALEHCPYHDGCAECECQDFCSDLGELCGYASATIRKQAKDIESMLQRERGLVASSNRLYDYNENLIKANVDLSSELLDARADAIKEFARALEERVKKAIYEYTNNSCSGYFVCKAVIQQIDELVKEMTEEQEDEV